MGYIIMINPNILNKTLSKKDIVSLLNTKENDILELMKLANTRSTNKISFSKNVFIPLTEVCKNNCGYCAFKKDPLNPDTIILKRPDEVLKLLKEAEKFNCKEALFTMGEDADTEKAVQDKLKELGYSNMGDYIYSICKMTLDKTSLLPHTNAGNFSYETLQKLKEVNVSMGMMLENSSPRLMETIAHEKSPGKDPKIRLETIENAGKLKIPYTTGLLIGIGETKEEIAESLLTLKDLQDKYGHIQEIIIQNFTTSPGIEMCDYSEPSLLDMIRTVCVSKIIFKDELSIQVPPNLNLETNQIFLLCGTDDWGGVSPLTDDYVNPTSPWPTFNQLERLTFDAGYQLQERLAIYKKYINPEYLNDNLLAKVNNLLKSMEK